LFSDLRRARPVLGTATLLVQVLFLLEAFAPLAVKPLVEILEQRRLAGLGAAGIIQAPEQLLHRQLVARVGGADELVVGDAERLPGGGEGRSQFVHEGTRGLARRFGGAGDLLTVLVGAGEEEGGIAALAVEARQGVGQHLLVGMAQVWPAVRSRWRW
jgi:hypothetical protein